MKDTSCKAVKMLKNAKETVMKQFNSTSRKKAISPLYSMVELEVRMSKYGKDELWLLSHPPKCMHAVSAKNNKNDHEKNVNRKGLQT